MLDIILLSLVVAMPPFQQRMDTTFTVDARGRIDLENHSTSLLPANSIGRVIASPPLASAVNATSPSGRYVKRRRRLPGPV